MKKGKQSFISKAQSAWDMVPEWVEALALACDRASARFVADQLGVNAAYVSYVINGDKFEYHARVEDAVRARLMGERVDCPVLGEIAPDRCGALRRNRKRALGPVEKQLRATCPGCLHNRERELQEAGDVE